MEVSACNGDMFAGNREYYNAQHIQRQGTQYRRVNTHNPAESSTAIPAVVMTTLDEAKFCRKVCVLCNGC